MAQWNILSNLRILWKKAHHLPTLMSLQTCILFFLLWNSKEHILKNVGNQAVMVPNDFHMFFKPYDGSQWELKLLGYQHSTKYLLLYSRAVLHASFLWSFDRGIIFLRGAKTFTWNQDCFFFFYIYSQVHKYWDIDTILTFLALYTTTMDFKWNEQDVL